MTEIQTLFAVKDPRTGQIKFRWVTSMKVTNLHEAKRMRTPNQRIVRTHTSTHPGHVVSYDGRSLHIFENPITPIEDLKEMILNRLRTGPRHA